MENKSMNLGLGYDANKKDGKIDKGNNLLLKGNKDIELIELVGFESLVIGEVHKHNGEWKVHILGEDIADDVVIKEK